MLKTFTNVLVLRQERGLTICGHLQFCKSNNIKLIYKYKNKKIFLQSRNKILEGQRIQFKVSFQHFKDIVIIFGKIILMHYLKINLVRLDIWV